MDTDTTRRALIAAIVGGGVVGGSLSPVRGYLDRFAPFSGSAWRDATDRTDRRVESPYGPAEVGYDDYGTAHVESEGESGGEQALYFAVGYAQAADRLFQMDLQRRVMRGQLSEVVGEATLDSDEFHVRMDFVGGAEANLELLEGTPTGDAVEAFAEGVNACRENEELPLEFGLLDYEPDPWTPADTMLMEQQISWGLTGSFWTLRRELVAEELGADAVEELYPFRTDHDAPILRDGSDSESADRNRVRPSGAVDDADLLDWLGEFESPPGVGSNSWVVSGEHTESGAPVVANDPHLTLMAPPVWYEMNLRTDDVSVRGVTFPGVPFVVIGENHAGAWGFTNTGADVIDFYTYETDRSDDSDGSGESEDSPDRYRYRGEWREFDTEERTISVADGEDREVTVRKTVHGPVVEREGQQVGVAWTGLTATETSRAVHLYSESDGMDEFLEATRRMDLPTQNVVYADRDGNTLYYVTGKIPRRTIDAAERSSASNRQSESADDGEELWGTRVFDGSAGEAEWEGFEPFGVSSWEGFVPFEEKPHAINPEYVGTANQRIEDDPEHYIGESYATPYRGKRLYDLLDRRADSDEPVDPEFMKQVQRDTRSERARHFRDDLAAAVEDRAETGDEDLRDAAETLRNWDARMDRDSRAALVFLRWIEHFRGETFGDEFAEAGLDESYYPNDWVLANLPADSRWFGDEGREAVMVRALREALDGIEDGATYGDYNTTESITHPFDQSFLNYPAYPTDGSAYTLWNYRKESAVGSSWRMICPMDAATESVCILPGGNSGNYVSDHYDDQLRMWADGEYKPMSREIRGETAIRFGSEEGDE